MKAAGWHGSEHDHPVVETAVGEAAAVDEP